VKKSRKLTLLFGIMLLSCFVCSHVKIADAGGVAWKCVKLGYKKSPHKGQDSQTLENVCAQKIEVVWCHDNDENTHKNGKCGRNGKFYQKHTVLEPGQVEDNFIMLPAKATISYGACFGGYYSTKQTENGEYICK